jgi:hypothetical protein
LPVTCCKSTTLVSKVTAGTIGSDGHEHHEAAHYKKPDVSAKHRTNQLNVNFGLDVNFDRND